MKTQKRAFTLYFLGLFIMPMGVTILLQSNLGPPPLAFFFNSSHHCVDGFDHQKR